MNLLSGGQDAGIDVDVLASILQGDFAEANKDEDGNVKIKLPKQYAYICELRGHCNYKNMTFDMGDGENYVGYEFIGKGKYSKVYYGENTATGEEVAIKVLNQTNLDKIKREIKILQILDGKNYVIGLRDIVPIEDDEEPEDPVPEKELIDEVMEKKLMYALIFEYVPQWKGRRRMLYDTFEDYDVRNYMYDLF